MANTCRYLHHNNVEYEFNEFSKLQQRKLKSKKDFKKALLNLDFQVVATQRTA